MKRLVLIIVIILLTVKLYAQNILKNFVSNESAAIQNIDPDSTNFADLAPLGKAIGDARMVLLGEQDHGDAPTFLAKTRIIKYLHEKLGFNLLAFESDFFALNEGWRQAKRDGIQLDSFLQKNIFPIWTFCPACKQLLYSYIPNTQHTQNPITVTGFDNQLVLNFSQHTLARYLDSVCRTNDLPFTHEPGYQEFLRMADSLKLYGFKDPANYTVALGYLNRIDSEMSLQLGATAFQTQTLKNLIAELRQYSLMTSDSKASGNIRDRQMANNIAWLANKQFPEEKMIVWAANAHVARYSDTAGNNTLTAMGYYLSLDASVNNKMYIIGFTSFEGEAGRLGAKKFKIPQPQANSFETWIPESFAYAFTDFKTFHSFHANYADEFYLKGYGHQSRFKKDWTKVFDGVFFIRKMYSCLP